MRLNNVEKESETFIKNGKDALTNMAGEIEDRAVKAYDVTRTEFKRVGDKAEKSIKRNPLLSLAVAGGVGFLLASAFMRSRKE